MFEDLATMYLDGAKDRITLLLYGRHPFIEVSPSKVTCNHYHVIITLANQGCRVSMNH